MGLFEKIFGKSKTEEPKAEDVIDQLLMMATAAMDAGDFERAVQTYRNILKLEPNETAQYNLGSLYAQGKGVKQDFKEGAYWFRQAELAGEENAGKLCMKCILDYTHQDFDQKSSEQLYTDMAGFVKYVYPEITDVNLEVCRKLYAIAGNHLRQHDYVSAAKLFRAAAEFGNDGYSQNYLAVLYNAGAGLEKNDLASLYCVIFSHYFTKNGQSP